MIFPRKGYWSGLPCCPPGDLPHPEMESESLLSPALAGICLFDFVFSPGEQPGKPMVIIKAGIPAVHIS